VGFLDGQGPNAAKGGLLATSPIAVVRLGKQIAFRLTRRQNVLDDVCPNEHCGIEVEVALLTDKTCRPWIGGRVNCPMPVHAMPQLH
jgi:hypothetical protein